MTGSHAVPTRFAHLESKIQAAIPIAETIERKEQDKRAQTSSESYEPYRPAQHQLTCNLEEGHFIREYMDYWKKRTDAYTEFHHMGAVTLLSITIDRKVIIPLSFGDVYTNTWCMALGQSSVSRKTTALNKASLMAGAVYYETALPGSFSTEALFEKLSDHPKAWMIKDECAAILQGINKKAYLADLRDFLAEIFECQSVRRSLRTSKKKDKTDFLIIDPYVTLSWATTPENFEESVTPLDVRSGLLARFLYYYPRYPKDTMGVRVASPDMKDNLNTLGNRYSAVSKAFSRYSEITMKPCEESLKEYNIWYTAMQKRMMGTTTIEGTVFSRISTYAFKLAAIYYIGSIQFISDADDFIKTTRPYDAPKRPDGQTELIRAEFEIPHQYFMEALNNIRDYFLPVAVSVVSDITVKSSNNVQKQIIQYVREMGGSVTRSDLLRKLRLTSKVMEEHITTLEEAESIKRDWLLGKEGKKIEWIFLLREEGHSNFT